MRSIICAGGSDTANLDDMVIALLTGGLSLPQAILALLPEAPSLAAASDRLTAFHEAMSVFLGACDGPAAIVACDGDEAVAHLDRNGLRPLWLLTTQDYALAASELTGTVDLGPVETQKLFGPGDTVVVNLKSGDVLLTDEVHRLVSGQRFPAPRERVAVEAGRGGGTAARRRPAPAADRVRHDARGRAGAARGARGHRQAGGRARWATTRRPRRCSTGCRAGSRTTSSCASRRRRARRSTRSATRGCSRPRWRSATARGSGASTARTASRWPRAGPSTCCPSASCRWPSSRRSRRARASSGSGCSSTSTRGPQGLEAALDDVVARGLNLAGRAVVIVLSDRGVDGSRAAVPVLRVASRLHDALVKVGLRHRVGIVADAAVWDIHHAALLVAVGADALCPWLGCLSAGEREKTYLKGLRGGFVEAMSMMGVTPASAYCGAKLIEAVGLDPAWLRTEFPGVARHLGGHRPRRARPRVAELPRGGLPARGARRARRRGRVPLPAARRARTGTTPTWCARSTPPRATRRAARRRAARRQPTTTFAHTVNDREPLGVLDLLRIVPHAEPVALEEVESEEHVLWRFMAPGMSEGALSEPAHRAVARAMNALHRYCLAKFREREAVPPGIGPIANSGEGGFDKNRIGRADGNRSIQYAGARFTVTPMTASRAAEAEVKFAQGAKPGKGGQLPGKKVSARIAQQRGCEPGYELVSPPVNHNLYSIEDVKLMVESWRHLNPDVRAALKFVATHGVEMACMGGVNAGANRLHLSDGCGGTGAAKRVDQKHGGVPVAAVLPAVQDMLVEEGVRERVELSVDGGVLTGEHALKLMLLGRGPRGLRHLGVDVDRLLDAAPVPHGRPAARRHDRQAPPGLHARSGDAGPGARRALHRQEPARRRGCCSTSLSRCAS